MSDRDIQENRPESPPQQQQQPHNFSYTDQPFQKKDLQQSYPTFQSISQQINLLDLQDDPTQQKTINNEFLLKDIKITKTDNPSLFDLESIDININDHNTNLLDIASNDNSLEIIKFLDGRQITIDDEMEIIAEGYITSYKLYTIYSKSKFGGQTTEVKRRFSDFEFLQQLLFDLYPGRIIPILPQKNFWASLNMEGKDYSLQRIKRLKKYLDSLLMNEKLRVTPELRLFLFGGTAEFSELKGEYEEKSKIEDKVKTVAGRVFEMGKEFITSLVSKGNGNEAKCLPIEYISKDNLQITDLCRKLKVLYESIAKLKPQITNKIKQFELISNLDKNYITINVNTKQINDELVQSFEDTEYYIESCWEVLNRYGRLYQQLEILKKQEQSMIKKYKDNPRSKDMDLLKTKTKRLSQKLQKSNTILQQQIKTGTLRAEFLFKSLLDLYLKYRRIQYM